MPAAGGSSSDSTSDEVKSQRPDTNDSDLGPSVLEGPANTTDEPKSKLQSIEVTPLPNGTKEDSASPSDTPDPATASDADELRAPALDADSAAYRIRYRPLFTREI